MYLFVEFVDCDVCVLSWELFGFSLKEDDDWGKEDKFVGNFGLDLKFSLVFLNDRKILF